MSLVRPDGSFVVDVLPASLIAAAGMALAFIPSLGTAISSAQPEEGGLASGIVNTSYQVGSALGSNAAPRAMGEGLLRSSRCPGAEEFSRQHPPVRPASACTAAERR